MSDDRADGPAIASEKSGGEESMICLYNRLADCMSFSPAGWQEVLANARAYGWEAEGTLPPGRLETASSDSGSVTWDGNYSRPVGQLVAPNDAAALAAAIEKASKLADWKENNPSDLLALAAFCLQRGFVVSPSPFHNPSAQETTARESKEAPQAISR
jgi:hypothetical protein